MKIDEVVSQMMPPRLTVVQAAAMIHKDPDTIRRWIRMGVVEPYEYAQFGSLRVPLFLYSDLPELRRVAKTMKPGRKPRKATEVHSTTAR